MAIIKKEYKEGYVEINMPSERKKLNYMKEIVKFDQSDKAQMIQLAEYSYDIAGMHVNKVSLKAGNKAIKTWEELIDESDFDEIAQDVINTVLGDKKISKD